LTTVRLPIVGPHIALAVIVAGNGRKFEPGARIEAGTLTAMQAQALEQQGYVLHVAAPGARFFKPGIPFAEALRALRNAEASGVRLTSPSG
jgi:hypothetical protein